MFVVLFAGILWRWELQHGGSTTHHMEKLVQPRSLPLRFMKQRPNWLWDLLRGRVRPGNRNHKHQVLKICYINTCGHQNPRTHSKFFYNYAEKTRTAMVVGDVIALLSVPIPHSKFQSMFFSIYIYIYIYSPSTVLHWFPLFQDRKSWLDTQKLSVTGRTVQAQQVALEVKCTQEEVGFQAAQNPF